MVSCRTSDLQCAHLISKHGAPLSKAVGPGDASFLVVKKNLTLIENIHLTVSLQIK